MTNHPNRNRRHRARLSDRELAMVLASLRLWQLTLPLYGDPLQDIATRGGELVALDDNGIDKLCERLNHESGSGEGMGRR